GGSAPNSEIRSLTKLSRLGGFGEAKGLRSLRPYPAGRHYTGFAATAAVILGGGLAQKQVARHCSQIAASGNTQSRHYSRFRPLLRLPRKQYQYLARSESLKIAKTRGESAN